MIRKLVRSANPTNNSPLLFREHAVYYPTAWSPAFLPTLALRSPFSPVYCVYILPIAARRLAWLQIKDQEYTDSRRYNLGRRHAEYEPGDHVDTHSPPWTE